MARASGFKPSDSTSCQGSDEGADFSGAIFAQQNLRLLQTRDRRIGQKWKSRKLPANRAQLGERLGCPPKLADLKPECINGEMKDPFKLLANFGREAMPQLIPSREVEAPLFSGGPENRFLVEPREASALRTLLREKNSLFGHSRLLRSHAINDEAAQALFDGDIRTFIQLRREEIVGLERTFVEGLGLTLMGD